MNFFIYSSGAFSISLIRFTLCIINDTVLSDTWDDCEAFHADFSSSDEISNESVIPENLSMPYEPDQYDDFASATQTVIPGETHFITTSPSLFYDSNQWEELIREWQYEVPEETLIETSISHHPQPSSQSESPRPFSNEWEELTRGVQNEEPEETRIGTTIPHHPQPTNQRESTSEMHNSTEMRESEKEVTGQIQKFYRKFVTIGIGSKGIHGNMTVFKDLIPGISTVHKLPQEQVEKILHSLGDEHRWEELKEYPVQNYYGYWANVCDYFWVKTLPIDELFRGCYVNTYIFPNSRAQIIYMHREMYIRTAKLEILRCKCYFYSHHWQMPNSTISDFSVHKYRNSEYLMLKEIPRKKYTYSVTDLLTQVYLPTPQNNSVLQESNETEESKTELQNDTQMVPKPGRVCKQGNLPHRKFSILGDRSKMGFKWSKKFYSLIPGKSNRHNLSKKQLEQELVSRKDKPRWRELKEYSLDHYIAYWGNVCDYFWKKPKPVDERFRGCYVRTAFTPYTLVNVILSHVPFSVNARKLEVLQCQCYYYLVNYRNPDSNKTDFAIHKHRDNVYFTLDKVPGTRYDYVISDLLTDVYLPDPTK